MARVLKPKPSPPIKKPPEPKLVFLYLCEFTEDDKTYSYVTSQPSQINPKDRIIGTKIVEVLPGKFDFAVRPVDTAQ